MNKKTGGVKIITSRINGNSTCQRGLTLIELLISIALSLVFISGAITFLVSSGSIADVQDASSRSRENAQFALDELSRAIRMAGFYNVLSPGSNIPIGQFYLGSCGDYDPCTADSSDTDLFPSDRIAILLNPPQDDGTDSDCVGNPVSTNGVVAANAVVAHSYRIESVDEVGTLVCESFLIDNVGGSTPVNAEPYQLVSGIDAMQFLYGKTNMEDVGQKRTRIERYVSATTIDSLPPPTGATTPWVDIATVKVALLAASGRDDRASSDKSKSYQLLDYETIETNDKNYRKVYTSTIQINNARY